MRVARVALTSATLSSLAFMIPRFVPLAVACALAAIAPAFAASQSRPNILWVVHEDTTFNYSGPYGDPNARTPVLDRLAKDGITYTRVYCPTPVCAPTRGSIITGRYAASLGAQHMRSHNPLPDGVRFFPEFLRDAGYFCTNANKTDYNTSTPFTAAWDRNHREATWRDRAPGQPFFAVINFAQSHESSLHSRRPLTTDPARVRVPAYLPDTPTVRADLAQFYDRVADADAAIGRTLDQLAEDGLLEDTIVFYYADNGGSVSRSKRTLYDSGTHLPLVVRFPEKFRHLAPHDAGSRTDELVSLVDLAPTVLSLAGVPLPAQFEGRAFAGPARSPAPAILPLFRDRMDERYDFSRAAVDGNFRYIRNYLPDQPWGQFLTYQWKQASQQEWAELHRAGKLDAAQRAFFEPKQVEELYDDEADPDNVHNLATDPRHRDTLERLRAALNATLLNVRDTGFMPEPMMLARAASRSPASALADETVYPLAEVIAFLDAVQLADAPPRDRLADAFRSSSPLLRYWSAVAARRAKVLPENFTRLLEDSEPVVRVAAAETLLLRETNAAAWRAFANALNDTDTPMLPLFALNALAHLAHPFPDPISGQVRALARPGEEVKPEDLVVRAARPLLER